VASPVKQEVEGVERIKGVTTSSQKKGVPLDVGGGSAYLRENMDFPLGKKGVILNPNALSGTMAFQVGKTKVIKGAAGKEK